MCADQIGARGPALTVTLEAGEADTDTRREPSPGLSQKTLASSAPSVSKVFYDRQVSLWIHIAVIDEGQEWRKRMSLARTAKAIFLERIGETEFDVSSGDFANLEIRPAADDKFYYFYDKSTSRLIKSFVLRAGPRVDSVCDVFLIKKESGFTPRLTFWKKDKSKGWADTLTEAQLIAERRTTLIKARVDTDGCNDNFWKLIDFLKACKEIKLPHYVFRLAEGQEAELTRALEGHDKKAVLTAVKTYLEGQVTEHDVQMLIDRRKTLTRFAQLLTNPEFFSGERTSLALTEEGVWQSFFEENVWIFGYGLTLLACEKFSDKKLERITSGANVFTGGGKRSDAVMRTRGFLQTLLFAEIKTHTTDLLMARPYREPDVYQVSPQVSGAVSQVQKTSHKAIKHLEDLHRSHSPSGQFRFEVSTIRPRQVVIVGNLSQLMEHGEINTEKMTSFELYRRDHQGVEILTFDELYERAKFIVASQESAPR